MLFAEVVAFHRPLAMHHEAIRLGGDKISQQPPQRLQRTLAVSHRLDRDRGVDDPAAAAAELDREVATRLPSARRSRFTVERNCQRSSLAT
ncbi:MAG TPA: hypothetical protein VI751_10330 [Actinomycetota bacterium]